jgi:hypothetical protein
MPIRIITARANTTSTTTGDYDAWAVVSVLDCVGRCQRQRASCVPRSDIVRFGVADAGRGPDGETAEADRPWVNVHGHAFSAQESLLKGEVDAGDQKATEKQREEPKNILAVRPLSLKYWLALAEMRSVTGERASKVVEAVRLSVLSSPNQHDVMVGR